MLQKAQQRHRGGKMNGADKVHRADDKKTWLERECEELGITYLGQIKIRNGSMLE